MHGLIFGFYVDFGSTAIYDFTVIIYGFTAIHYFTAVTCSLMVTFREVHWVELIWPQL